MWVRVLVAVTWLLAAGGHVYADTIALLPLDGEKRLEIYGQPVASEIGRALKAQGFDVVVVGAKMDVPDRAQLIVDGTIKADKNNAITVSIRIRDPHAGGTTLETLPATAASLTTIDKAAADLSTRIGPAVRAHLLALAKAPKTTPPPDRPVDTSRPPQVQGTAAPLPPLVAGVASSRPSTPARQLLARGLVDQLPRWAAQHKRDPHMVESERLSQTTQQMNADVGVALEVLTFSVEPGEVPLARARVRVRVIHHGMLLFERIVRTDTIVGDKGISDQDMAARTGREVLAIANAQLRRLVAGWR